MTPVLLSSAYAPPEQMSTFTKFSVKENDPALRVPWLLAHPTQFVSLDTRDGGGDLLGTGGGRYEITGKHEGTRWLELRGMQPTRPHLHDRPRGRYDA